MHSLKHWCLPPITGRSACLYARRNGVRAMARQKDHPIPPPTKMNHFGFSQGFFEKYELTDHIGNGSFGSVHVARHKGTGEKFAVKSAVKRRLGNYLQHDFVRRIQHEVDMGNHLGRSLNVVHLYEVFEDDKSVYLVMDLCSGGELWGRIKQGHFSEQKAARIITEILRTIAQCHARGVVIRDVKPENFLFQDESPNSPLKMVDFGLAEYCAPNQQLHDRAGTAIYCAPELLRSNYSFKADVWSAGVIAYELLADRLPFEDDDGDMLVSNLRNTNPNLANKEVFHAILYRHLDFEQPPWPSISDSAKDLVQRLLTRDPDARPTALEALHHPWLEAATSEQESSWIRAHSGQGSGSVVQTEDGELASRLGSDSRGSTSYDDTLVQRLQQFGTYNRIKQVALAKLASFMAEHDNAKLAALKEAFADRDEAGRLSDRLPYNKAVRILKSGDFDLSDIEVRQLLSSFHLDAQSCIDINEWLAALIDWREVQASEEWDDLIARVFDTFDVDHSGRLGASELESLLCEEECPMEDTVPAAMRAAEADAITSMDSMDWAGTGRGSNADSGEHSQDMSRGHQQSGLSAGQVQGGSQQMRGIDLPAFAKLLRTAQQDQLDLYESRRIRRKES